MSRMLDAQGVGGWRVGVVGNMIHYVMKYRDQLTET